MKIKKGKYDDEDYIESDDRVGDPCRYAFQGLHMSDGCQGKRPAVEEGDEKKKPDIRDRFSQDKKES